MPLAKITLIGLYQYMNEQNDPLFKNLSVPAEMDKDELINAILYKGAEFGCLYADPYFMQAMIKVWSDRYHHTLERWARALAIQYDPLENYDRREEWLDTGARSKAGNSARFGTEIDGTAKAGNSSRTGSEIGTDAKDGSGTSSDTTASASSEATSNSNTTNQTTVGTKASDQTDENKVSAYDSTAYQNKDKTDTKSSADDTTASSTGSSGTSNVAGNTQSVETHQTSDQQSGNDSRYSTESANDDSKESSSHVRNENVKDAETEDHSAVHTGRLHGNIGVTTSQQMLQSELDIARFNLYDESADLFLSEFCIYVY